VLNRLRGAATKIATPAARFLLARGVSPDAVTVTGTGVVVATALWAYPRGHLLHGTLVIALFVLTDSLDGTMARLGGRSSSWGAFLDSTLDRLADAAIFAGLVVWFTGEGDSRETALLALAALVLGSVVPYARARAEGLGLTASVGIAERADRLAVVLVATGVVGMGAPLGVLTVALAVLSLASLVTVVQRAAAVRAQTREG
jgi:Phosphatidylglycerophosphate synthase